jgi:hypothetical protein
MKIRSEHCLRYLPYGSGAAESFSGSLTFPKASIREFIRAKKKPAPVRHGSEIFFLVDRISFPD